MAEHPVSPAARASLCVECLYEFSPEELMPFSGFSVCAQCKPAAVAKVSRGEPVGRAWRSGKMLVVVVGSELPERCIVCNAPADLPLLKKATYWHHPALYYLFPLLPLFFIVMAMTQTKIEISFPLCRRDKESGGWWAVGGVICAALAIGTVEAIGYLAFLPGLAAIGCFCMLAIRNRVPTITPWHVTRTHVFFECAGEPFLRSLPEWPQPLPAKHLRFSRMGAD